MKLNPQEALLYGDCVLTVQLDEDEEKEADFYLIFSGSTQRHVSSTLRVSHVKLQAMCPGHNVCEQVLVTLCLARPDGSVDTHSQQTFSFIQSPEEAESLALKHDSQPHHRTAPQAPCSTHTDVQKGTVTVTDTHRPDTQMDVSSFWSSCPAVCEHQQPSSLLQLAASHGLKTAPAFLLQQPAGKEALRRTNTQGSAPACLAKGRGKQPLLELFTHYATLPDVQVEAEETLQVYPKGQVFQYHASVGTYTLTFLLQREGDTGTDSRGRCCLPEEVMELRRLMEGHKYTVSSGFPSLEERTQGDDSAAVSQTSCTSGGLCQREEKGWEHQGRAAARTGRNKKNKKRTAKVTRPAAESSGNQNRESARRPRTATGSGTLSPRQRAVATVTNVGGTQETPSPIRPVLGPGVERKCAGRKVVALPTASVVDKQEGQKQEVELPMRKLVSKTGRDTQSVSAEITVESAADGTVAMGQEQSQDSQTEQEEPSPVGTIKKSPSSDTGASPESTHAERKGRRVLWRDGGWTGSRMGPEAAGKTTWYEEENFEQVSSEDSRRTEVNSQSVWYDSGTTGERIPGQQEQGVTEKRNCDTSSPQVLGLSSPQLLEQALSAAPSQSHAAGNLPALSHGPHAQRREVQPEEEVRSDWKKAGVEGDREEASNRETSFSRRICETAGAEEGGEKLATSKKRRRKKRGKRGGGEAKLSSCSSTESQGYTEIQTESQQATEPGIQSQTQTGRTDGCCLPDSEPAWKQEADDDAMHLPGHTEIQARSACGAGGDVTSSDCGFMAEELSHAEHLTAHSTPVTASHTERSNDSSKDETVSSVFIASELGEADVSTVDIKTNTTVQPEATQGRDPGELESQMPAIPVQPAPDNADLKALPPNEDLTVTCTATESGIQIGLANSKYPKEFVKQSEDTELREEKPGHSVDPTGTPAGLVESVRPTEAAFVPADDRADVAPLHIREGSTESTAREYLEHCLAPEMLRGQLNTEKMRHNMRVGVEGGVEERSQSGDEDSATEACSMEQGRVVKQNYDEDLVAAAVAVVAVAIASAVVSIEVSQHLVDSMSESQVCAGREAGISPSLAQGSGAVSLSTAQCSQLSPQLIARADTENQPAAHSHSHLTNHITSIGEACVHTAEEAPSAEISCITTTDDQANSDLPSFADALQLPKHPKEEIQKESLHSKVFKYSPPKEEDNKPLPEVMTAEADGESQSHCQNPLLTEHRDPKDQAACPEEGDGQQHFQTREIPDQDTGHSVECRDAEWQDRSEDSEYCADGFPDLSASHSHTPGKESQPQLAIMPHQSSLALPVTPSNPASLASPTPQETTAPVESAELLSSANGNSLTASPPEAEGGKNQREAHDCVCVNPKDGVFEGLDTVEKGGEVEKLTVEETSHTGAAEQEQRGWDSAHTLQIQRESHVLCPVQPSLEHNALTPCTDIHTDRGTCVSLCLVQGESVVEDGLNVTPELDDGLIHKPEAPQTGVGDMDGQACGAHSSTSNALMQEAVSPSKAALSVDTSGTVSPQSSTLSWMSETEDRGGGGGEVEGGGDEEEKKDQLPETPVSSAVLRTSSRSLSPLRRHSWEPGRTNTATHMELSQSSLPAPSFSSLKSVSGEVKQAKTPLHRRSHSLESLEVGTAVVQDQTQCASISDQEVVAAGRNSHVESLDRGSLASLTEEEQEGDSSSIDSQTSLIVRCPAMFHHPTLTKSISMVTVTQRDIQGVNSFCSHSGSLASSISEDEPGPLQSETEGKGGPKIGRRFSYLRNKMSKRVKDKERRGEGKQESKAREKAPLCPPSSTLCQHSSRLLCNKETFSCNNCGVLVSDRSTEGPSVCAKNKTKQQAAVPEGVPGSSVNTRSKTTSSTSSLSSRSSSSRWSTVTMPDDHFPMLSPRRSRRTFSPHSNLAKSISSSNIPSLDDAALKRLKVLSQSTDSLNQGSKVNASTESLTDEGTEIIDTQLMEFENDIKDLEADSWSGMVDKKFLKSLKKDEVKRQDVIYELYQTEVHHVRTLKIMSEVYHKGLQKELQLDLQTLNKIFPVLDDLLEVHTEFLSLLLERKRNASAERQKSNNFIICSIGDILVKQFSGCSSVRMTKVYGKFCSRHNEAVSLYKELHAKDKRFQAFVKRTMSSSVVRRLSIPECILLVTQRITKYPVLIQRILQHTKESDKEHGLVSDALRLVKELITAVDNKVNQQEKKQRLKEVYSRTDSKSIMRMKSGQMFAKEDLIRGRKLLHDGALQLKNSAGRLKDVHAMLLTDVLVFLQEKDQKYVFASLDQRSTVISLHKLIVREVANEERGLFLITAGTEKPEMVEVLASSKEERNTWMAIIQDAMQCMEKDKDEGLPSETEEDRKQQENRAKEIRELLQRKDEQIISLLEEKIHIFRELGNCSLSPEDANTSVRERMLFRATPDNVTKGEPVINDAVREVEALHALVSGGFGAAACGPDGLTGGAVGPVCLPRRAETFGGFDSHQMNSSKNGEKEEGEESVDLRRTESDSVLKKGATASLQTLLKRNNEQLQRSVTRLHELLISLQAVVIQQDSFIEDQRQALNSQLSTTSSRQSISSSSSCSSLSSLTTSRPSSLIEQEKHRSLERQRQEVASLQKQQAAHQEEKRKREREWELKERALADREERLGEEEEQTRRRCQELTEEMQMLQRSKEEYQRDVEWLKEAQRRLDRDEEALRRDDQKVDAKREQSEELQRYQRTPSTNSDDSLRFHSTGSLDLDLKEAAEQAKEVELSSSAPTKEPFLRIGSKRMSKNFNPFSSKAQGAEKESQLPSRLLQLTKSKEKKEKKKKGKGGKDAQTENKGAVMLDSPNESDFFI
ncbi:A-kinase anchor protein 13-like isoform X6 [Oreochromis aureus]|uniref:A-kinase anchor protein 13-like isoform X6 n=1 Tax=Oreochromis aureus TaxID=47969 RepID=UPI00195380DE|nr:A-kinase anchor protein 13-like isoform X6 [Oreochromis aureus]